jgi:hypothetical protein
MRSYLILTALLEGLTGLALVLAPTFVISLLLSSPLDGPTGVLAARTAGIAILSLALAAWTVRDALDRKGIVLALLVYNSGVVLIFVQAILVFGLGGPLLWCVTGVHAASSIWGGLLLRKNASTGKAH